ncbi:MAG: hypothetical protein P1U89_03240 [Verrucomicrobiales bacterium]|nr:hypothetical protein [Verrucomicrobiales bacterium]
MIQKNKISGLRILAITLSLANLQITNAQDGNLSSIKTLENLDLASSETVLPNPGEILQVLDGLDGIDWNAAARDALKHQTKPSTELERDYFLGIYAADAFLAIQAKDNELLSSSAKNMFSLRAHLKIGISQLSNLRQLQKAQKGKDWGAIYTIIDQIYSETQDYLIKNQNEDAFRLGSLGAWFRGAEIVANLLEKRYDAQSSIVLYQPRVASQLAEMAGKIERYDEHSLAPFTIGLADYQKTIATFDNERLTEKQIGQIYSITQKALVRSK